MKCVTAIIPVRSGSVRCPNKNIRSFGDTTLLKHKIQILKGVKNISEVIVSTSDIKMARIAIESGVSVHIRDQTFSTPQTSGSELYECLGNAVSDDHMMYVTCVSPFVRAETYEKAIDLYFQNCTQNDTSFDSVVCCKNVKDFLWANRDGTCVPLNYNPQQAPPSQLLPDVYALTFGFNILSTQYVRDKKSIVGERPFFYQVDQVESIDIDTPFDFTVAELLYENKLESESQFEAHLEVKSNRPFCVLDCTIRDGGYLNNWNYTFDEVVDLYKSVSEAGVEYFEVGFMGTEKQSNTNAPHSSINGKWWNVSEQDIGDLIAAVRDGTKLAVMVHLEDISKLTKITNKINGLTMIRILVNPTKWEMNEQMANEYKEQLSLLVNLGYELTLNVAYIDTLTSVQLDDALALVVPGVKWIYLADTFGSLQGNELKRIIRYIHSQISKVQIGFHGHNNTQAAVNNTLIAIKNGVTIVDTTVLGQGRGGGNTPTEIFLQHANHAFDKEYDLTPILRLLDKYGLSSEQKLTILHTHTGLAKIHPNAANECLEKTGGSLEDSFNKI